MPVPGRHFGGPLPPLGEWTRLEVAAADIGLRPGVEVTGQSFYQNAGTAYWDKAGIVSRTRQWGQPFVAQKDWEHWERQQWERYLPEAVHEGLFRSPEQRSDVHRSALRDFFLEHAYTESFAVLHPLRLELADALRRKKELASEIPGGTSFAEFAGKWEFHYDSGGVREYVIDKSGKVSFAAISRDCRIQFDHLPRVWTLDFGDGKKEYVWVKSSHSFHVHHHDPAGARSPTLRGTAQRVIEAP